MNITRTKSSNDQKNNLVPVDLLIGPFIDFVNFYDLGLFYDLGNYQK